MKWFDEDGELTEHAAKVLHVGFFVTLALLSVITLVCLHIWECYP